MGADEWHDPHGIIPEPFKREFGDSETVADALRRAESRPSTTSLDERPRCPECNSTQVSAKASAMYGDENRREGGFKCGKSDCRAHFEEPVYNTVIPMNDGRTRTFSWIDPDELPDADARERLTPSLDVDRETAVRYAILLRAPWRDDEPLSYPEIAAALPYKDSWVGHRVREWRDGEHRELVPDPTAEPEPAPSNDPPIDARAAVARIGGDYEELVAERAGSTDAGSDTGAVATDGGRRSRWDAYGS